MGRDQSALPFLSYLANDSFRFQPVTARLIRKEKDATSGASSPHTQTLIPNRFRRLLGRHHPRPPSGPPKPKDVEDGETDEEPSLSTYDDGTPIEVAVFVQMPTPHNRSRPQSSSDELPIPEISVGVTQVPLRTDGHP